jgi:glycosyltransferase involved in cell wall biosynthesis
MVVPALSRILVLTSFYPPHHYGGYELACKDVVDRWRAGGHDVAVLTSDVTVPDAVALPDDPAITRTLQLYWNDHELITPSLMGRMRTEQHNQRALAEALADQEPDVVSIWHMGALSLGLITTLAERDVPIVVNLQDDWLVYGPQLDAWVRYFDGRPRRAALARRISGVPTQLIDIGAAGAFCFVSEATKAHAEQRGRWRYPRSAVVWSGIDPTVFRPPDRAREGWRWRLLYVGRIDPRKGVTTAVRALAALPDQATLDIVGRGDEHHRAEVRALSDAIGVSDRVRYRFVDRSELPQVYADADVCIFPSTWQEPFGLVPLEAMGCGTPVVATGTGGSGEFCLDERNCLLFTPNAADELAAAIRRLEADEGLRKRLVAGGRATAEELSIDRLADVLEQWHVAAAAGYPDGQPAQRPRPLTS